MSLNKINKISLEKKIRNFRKRLKELMKKLWIKKRNPEIHHIPRVTISDSIFKDAHSISYNSLSMELQCLANKMDNNQKLDELNNKSFVKFLDSSGEHIVEIIPPFCSLVNNSIKYYLSTSNTNKQCLVIDLDETLVHCSFLVPFDNIDPYAIFNIDIEGESKQIYLYCRPYLKEFLSFIKDTYECVLFTASMEKYASSVLEIIDPHDVFEHRLYRDSCSFCPLGIVKDLSKLGRNLNRTLIIDNSPICYLLNVENAINISSWICQENDCELLDLIHFLKFIGIEEDLVVSLKRHRNYF